MPRPDFLHPFARPAATTDQFLSIVRGEGSLVFDKAGRPFIDAVNARIQKPERHLIVDRRSAEERSHE